MTKHKHNWDGYHATGMELLRTADLPACHTYAEIGLVIGTTPEMAHHLTALALGKLAMRLRDACPDSMI